MTGIEWTERTWNPIVGCSVVSPGCTNCYAMRTAHRLGRNPSTPQYRGLTKMARGGAVWTGRMRFVESALTIPLRRRKPTMYFVNSMSDLFAEDVPDEWIDRIFAIMALCPQHQFQVLTKRPERMRDYFRAEPWDRLNEHCGVLAHWDDMPSYETTVLPHVWLGVSVEDQARANERIPALLDTPAAIRFVSAEPLLGPVDLWRWIGVHHHPNNDLSNPDTREAISRIVAAARAQLREEHGHHGLDWVIVGGESGPGARPMHPDWARSLRDQCQAAGVPFFFKQWGEWGPDVGAPEGKPDRIMEGRAPCAWWNGTRWVHEPNGYAPPLPEANAHGQWVYRLGKTTTGRCVDGALHDEMPFDQPNGAS